MSKTRTVTASLESVNRAIGILDRVGNSDAEPVDWSEYNKAVAVLTAVSISAFDITESSKDTSAERGEWSRLYNALSGDPTGSYALDDLKRVVNWVIANGPSMKVRTEAQHRERHIFLHRMLDELVADFIGDTTKTPSETTLMVFMQWSHAQTQQPSPLPAGKISTEINSAC